MQNSNSCLYYCKDRLLSLLYGQTKCILRCLQCVLNSAARLIYLTSRHEHITPLLIQVGYLLKIAVKIAVIIFKALHGAAPITDLVKPYRPGRVLHPLINCS